MKIGIDARFYGPSHAGLGRYTKNLVDQLAKLETHHQFVVFLHTSNFDLFTTDNPNFTKVEVPIAHYSLKEQTALPKILHQHNLDLMHFPHLNVPIGYKGKFVVTIHDLIMHKFKNRAVTTKVKPVYELKHMGYRAVTRWAAKKAQQIIVPTEAVKDEIVNFYKLPPERVTVTYEAADDMVIPARVKHSERKAVLERYNIKGKFIMYVGNVYPHKNIETLAKAMSELHRKYDLSLVLPSARSVFLQRTEDMMIQHNVREYANLPGFVPDEDLAVLYQSAEAYVFPSLAEGFGLPALEAMMVGLPVVCSDIPPLREVCGPAAKYFDPHSSDSLAKVVGKVVADESLQQAMRTAGYEQVKKFSWAKMVQETLLVYQGVGKGVGGKK